VQAHVAGLARALARRGVSADIIAPLDGEAGSAGIVRAGRSISVRSNGSVQRVAISPAAALEVARLVRSGRYDLVHLHEPMLPVVCLTAALLAPGPIVGTFHKSSPDLGWYRPFAPLCRLAARRMACRVAVSQAARAHVERVCPGHYEIVPNGVDVARLSRLDGTRSGNRVLFVGRPEARKGLSVLIGAFAGLGGRPRLDLVGVTRSEVAPLLRGMPPEAVARIHPHGRVDEATRDRFLAAADVLSAPSLSRESFGLVIAEGMAAGLPVVASDLDGYREVMPEACGAFVPPGEPDALRAALQRLLDHPELRASSGAAGRAAARRFDWATVADRILELYRFAMARPRGAG
jgi:phosphatidylinositol alpha-mannosyltransferase